MMKKIVFAALAASASMLASVPASAAINWTDWTSSTATTVSGTVGGVGVTYSGGGIGFVQTSGGTDYWNGSFISSWDGTIAPPPTSDIIALDQAGVKTITFASAVTDVYLALNSWNGNAATFDKNFTAVGFVNGCGYWGCGLLQNVTANSFTSAAGNEIHGILKFGGPITSISFTDQNDEFWHGIQVGVSAVPEPAAWMMMIGGFAIVGGAMRRRRTAWRAALA